MNILILGATGFIGNSIFLSLVNEYNVTIGSRTPIDGYDQWIKVDLNRSNNWDSILENTDLVINAIGIIEGDFDQIQTIAPLELYKVCIKKKCKIIHISAIGAEKTSPPTLFLKTKKITDNYLLQYENAKVIYPGIVIGKNGKSTQFFTEIAQLPLIPLFSNNKIPFIHIDQLTQLIKHSVENFKQMDKQQFAVAEAESLKEILTALKGAKANFIVLPNFITNTIFTLFPFINIGLFNKDTFSLYKSIKASDYTPLFGKVSKQVKPNHIQKSNTLTILFALLAISFIWIWSGISSLVTWNESMGFMQEIGANKFYSVLFIYLGSITDILLGIAVLSKKYRKETIILQVITMLLYMLILTVAAPHYWLHPFGVISKNIPLIALSYYLYQKKS